MKRRVFMRNTVFAGIGMGVGMSGCTTPKKEDKGEGDQSAISPFFKLSLAQWSIHKMILQEGMDPYDFSIKARQWGFEGLEYVTQLYKGELQKGFDIDISLQKIAKKLNLRSQDQGLKNLVVMVDLQSKDGNMAMSDETQRLKAVENHYPYVDATATLGCHSMRVNMFGESDPERWKSASVDALGRLGEYAAKQNINILIENHGGFTSNASLLMEVINEVNMDNCGTLPDFGNFCIKRKPKPNWNECKEEYDKYRGMEELMPGAMAVSAKSYDFDENGNETTIDYSKMLQIVKNAEYRGFIGVEYEGGRLSEEEGIIATRDLLTKLGSELV